MKTNSSVTRNRSGPVRSEIVDATGRVHGPFSGLLELQTYADRRWPNQADRDDFEVRATDVEP